MTGRRCGYQPMLLLLLLTGQCVATASRCRLEIGSNYGSADWVGEAVGWWMEVVSGMVMVVVLMLVGLSMLFVLEPPCGSWFLRGRAGSGHHVGGVSYVEPR